MKKSETTQSSLSNWNFLKKRPLNEGFFAYAFLEYALGEESKKIIETLW